MRLLVLLLVFAALPLSADNEPADFTGMLSVHNTARSAVGVAPLQWSNALAAEAQQWADQLAGENCQLRYDPSPQRRETTGQNLYRSTGSTAYEGYKRSAADAAARWLREGQSYDHGSHQCKSGLGSQCGAYLQVIWDRTTALGCGRARCASGEVWACHYAPRGGQEGLKPYGNAPQAAPVSEAAPAQQCHWTGPTPAQQLGDALSEQFNAPQ